MAEVNVMQQLSNSGTDTRSDDRYKAIGLDFNPFPLMPTPSKVKFVSGKDRKEKVRAILEQVERVKNGNSITMGIIGDYGLGKSHLLKHIEYKLSRDPETNPDENIVSYIHRPYDPREKCDLCYLCSSIIDYLNLSRKEDFLTSLAQRAFSKVAIKIIEKKQWNKLTKIRLKDKISYFSKKRTERYQKTVLPYLKNDFGSIYDMEEEIDFYKLKKAVIDEITEQFETKNSDRSDYIDTFFFEKITEMFFEDESDEAWNGIKEQFSRSNNEARKFIKTVINTAKYVDYRIFAILLDEIDQIPENELKMLLGELTIFIEESGEKAPPPNLLFVLSYTPKPELLSPFYERRLSSRIGLERISKEDTKEMIVDYLNEARGPCRSLTPFDEESIVSIWEKSRGGQIGDILKSCFWMIEEMADKRLRAIDALAEISKNMESDSGLVYLPPPKAITIPIKPSQLDRKRVLSLYDSKKRNAERSKLLEDAVRTLCKTQKNYSFDSFTITGVADKKRRLETKGGKKKSREVDIYLTGQKGKGPEEIIDIEIKAYDRYDRNNRNSVKLNELEGSFELLERKQIDKLIIFTVTDLNSEVQNKMREFENRVAGCQIDEDQLAQLIYSTDNNFFGRELKQEEAKQVALDIGLIEYL